MIYRSSAKLLRLLFGKKKRGGNKGPGEPTLAGQPIGLLLALTYSATVVE
jgi:hypothetical protein